MMSYQGILEHREAAVLSRGFPSPETALDQASQKVLDRLHRQCISTCSFLQSVDFLTFTSRFSA
jgi:hypothetical protein